MGSNELGATANERRILLAALRAYSDSCALPTLSPDCPYFQMSPNGPTCGEQCLDILAEHRNEVPPSMTVWDLGDGWAAYPSPTRKARRGPGATTRPFDAQVYSVRDKDKPTDAKHTVALLKDLVDLSFTPPQLTDDMEERSYLIRASIDELAQRGFDRLDLTAIVAHMASIGMTVWSTVATIVSDGGPDETKLGFDVPTEWNELATDLVRFDPSDASPSVAFERIDWLSKALFDWHIEQDLDALIAWTLPPKPYIDQYTDSSSSNSEALGRAKWLIDRFTRTYPHSWNTTSLDMEWKYIHGNQVGCCDSEQMKLRRLNKQDIAITLADRAVISRKAGAASARKVRASDFTQTAIGLLLAGRYESAAAMYEALHQLEPNDPEMTNNLGFCLMPIDPERALSLLEKATEQLGEAVPVTWANHVAVLYLLGRRAEAADLASQGCKGAEGAAAWLWLLDDSAAISELGTDIAVTAYVQDLVERLGTDA